MEDVRALLRGRGLAEVVWWVGERSTPGRPRRARSACSGSCRTTRRELTTLAIGSRPAGEASVEVRRAGTLDDFVQALEIDWESFGVPADERAERRAAAQAAGRSLRADGRSSIYLAYLDGEPVGFGRAIFTPAAGC